MRMSTSDIESNCATSICSSRPLPLFGPVRDSTNARECINELSKLGLQTPVILLMKSIADNEEGTQ